MKKILFAICVLSIFSAHAGPGHDHAHDAPAAAAAAPAAPRFSAASDLFEVVGILSKDNLSLFVDRFDTNEPVTEAVVELESGSFKAKGTLNADIGDFVFASGAFAKPGTYPIQLTVTAGDDVDILAANLVIPAPAETHRHDLPTRQYIVLAISWLIIAITLAMIVRFFLKSRHRKLGGIRA
jgi:hypothetical protein